MRIDSGTFVVLAIFVFTLVWLVIGRLFDYFEKRAQYRVELAKLEALKAGVGEEKLVTVFGKQRSS